MDAIGLNIYLGGFGMGVEAAGINFLGSIEPWKPGRQAAEKIGRSIIYGGDVPRADLVITNPPCTRFSVTGCAKFDDASRTAGGFDELKQAMVVAKAAGAKVLWIENGPGMYRSNMDIEMLESDDYFKHSMMILFDARCAGLAQARPRTHLILSKQPIRYFEMQPAADVSLSTWTRSWCGSCWGDYPHFVGEAPWQHFRKLMEGPRFGTSTPQAYHHQYSDFCRVIMGGYANIWMDEDRYWTMAEFAGAMGYPPFNVGALGNPAHACTMIGKSVSPTVSQYIAQHVLTPTLMESGYHFEFRRVRFTQHRYKQLMTFAEMNRRYARDIGFTIYEKGSK